jgi:hypothetical protein
MVSISGVTKGGITRHRKAIVACSGTRNRLVRFLSAEILLAFSAMSLTMVLLLINGYKYVVLSLKLKQDLVIVDKIVKFKKNRYLKRVSDTRFAS